MSDRPKRVYVNGSEIRTFRDFRFESDGGYPDRLNGLEDEVARLRAKCNRLQAGIRNVERWAWENVGEPYAAGGDDSALYRISRVQPGDLEREPDATEAGQ